MKQAISGQLKCASGSDKTAQKKEEPQAVEPEAPRKKRRRPTLPLARSANAELKSGRWYCTSGTKKEASGRET